MTDLLTAHLDDQPDKMAVPKTGSGKVLERRLRQPFWKGRGSNV